MKKFLFSALACVAFAGSGFASNEVVSEIAEIETVTTSVENNEMNSINKTSNVFIDSIDNNSDPCQLTVRVYAKTKEGGLRLIHIGGYSSSSEDCLSWATGIINDHKKKYPEAQVTYELTANPR